MSNTILSVILLIYCQIIDMIFYFHYFVYVGRPRRSGLQSISCYTVIFFCIIFDKLNIPNYEMCP